MPKIIFVDTEGTERAVDATIGQSLMTVAVNNDIPGIEGECGGEMACGTCHIKIHDEWSERVPGRCAEEAETIDILVVGDVQPNSRLGCQVEICADMDGFSVTVPGEE